MTTQQAAAVARYQAITGWLAAESRVDVVDVARRLGVAQETIRRDLRTLESEGKLQRVHGGAVPLGSGPPAPTPLTTSDRDDLELSMRVWALLPRTGTVLLGAGRLTLALAQVILADPPERAGLTVVTNSLDAALVLSRARHLSVYNIGGTVSPLTRAQEGDWALAELERLHVDVSVICPTGVSAERGLTHDTPSAAAISQVEVSSGSRVIVLADAETLGRAAFVQFATLEPIEQIAVSGGVDPAQVQQFLDRGIPLNLVSSTDQQPVA